MATINFYLDKPGKDFLSPIHLVIREKEIKIKIATGEKTRKEDWDGPSQRVMAVNSLSTAVNKFLNFLTQEVEKIVGLNAYGLTDTALKSKVKKLVNTRRENIEQNILHDSDYCKDKQGITFIRHLPWTKKSLNNTSHIHIN